MDPMTTFCPKDGNVSGSCFNFRSLFLLTSKAFSQALFFKRGKWMKKEDFLESHASETYQSILDVILA